MPSDRDPRMLTESKLRVIATYVEDGCREFSGAALSLAQDAARLLDHITALSEQSPVPVELPAEEVARRVREGEQIEVWWQHGREQEPAWEQMYRPKVDWLHGQVVIGVLSARDGVGHPSWMSPTWPLLVRRSEPTEEA